jgi:glycosyltransferase involved in cell wall biosynthesis
MPDEPARGALGSAESEASSRRPRVAFVLDTLGAGGTQRVVAAIVERLSDRFRFMVVGLGADDALAGGLRAAGASTETLNVRRWNPFVAARLAKALRSFGPELVVAALYKASLVAPRAAAALGVPYALADRSRTYDPRVRAGFFPAPGLSSVYWAAYRRAASGASSLLVQSMEDVREYERAAPVLRGRVAAIPNSVEVARFALDDAARAAARRTMRARWNLPEDAVVFGAVMALRPDKRPRLLAEAAEWIDSKASIVVVGDGPLLAGLRDRGRARFVGSVPWDEVPLALAAFDVFVLPSVADPYPNAVLEAMAAGLPVVAARSGGCAEMVVDGRTGILLPAEAGPDAWAAALNGLGGDVAARRAMGSEGRLRAGDVYSPSAFDRAWTASLRAAIGRDRPAGG